MKVSAVAPERHVIEAPARVFQDQEAVKRAFRAGEFTGDTVVVVRFQGPKANGMPELHSLTPVLAVLQDRGLKVALVTDGRMSGASGKVPSAIHVSPEALDGGPLARLHDGDLVRVDAVAGTLDVLTPGVLERPNVRPDLVANGLGIGRELFGVFRNHVGAAEPGASPLLLRAAAWRTSCCSTRCAGCVTWSGRPADRLRAEGHEVLAPDLFDGEVPATLEDGLALEERLWPEPLIGRAQAAARRLPAEAVLAGFSMGAALAAQIWADRPETAGLLLFHGIGMPTGPVRPRHAGAGASRRARSARSRALGERTAPRRWPEAGVDG